MGGGADPGGARNIFERNGGAYETFGKNMVGGLNHIMDLPWGVGNIFEFLVGFSLGRVKHIFKKILGCVKQIEKFHQPKSYKK